jgi:hypothetical protein
VLWRWLSGQSAFKSNWSMHQPSEGLACSISFRQLTLACFCCKCGLVVSLLGFSSVGRGFVPLLLPCACAACYSCSHCKLRCVDMRETGVQWHWTLRVLARPLKSGHGRSMSAGQ